jgi:DNA polymerase-3 subunit alpha
MGSGVHEIFVQRSNKKEEVSYPYRALEPILKDTYGIIIFQEQVMEAVKVIGGFNDEEADDCRKAMGKKKVELLDNAKSKFINNAINTFSDINEELANKLWDMIYSFGGYGFCKAHAVSYSLIAYICMWLKHHYPMEWWCSVLKHETNNDIIKYYYNSNKDLFILPNVNVSKEDYAIENNKIVMPLTFLTKVGEKACKEIISHQPYQSFRDFCDRNDGRIVNRGVILSLIWSDAFDFVADKKDKELATDFYHMLVVGKRKGEINKILTEMKEEVEYLNRFDIIRKKAESCVIFEADYQKYFKDV